MRQAQTIERGAKTPFVYEKVEGRKRSAARGITRANFRGKGGYYPRPEIRARHKDGGSSEAFKALRNRVRVNTKERTRSRTVPTGPSSSTVGIRQRHYVGIYLRECAQNPEQRYARAQRENFGTISDPPHRCPRDRRFAINPP
jgi:hypothetical protein